LRILIGDYLRGLSVTSTQIDGIVKFYQKTRSEAVRALEDGTGHKPHYSLRTLCRALTIAATNMFGSVPRSVYEAFCLSFLTQLDRKSHPAVEGMIATQIMQKKNLGLYSLLIFLKFRSIL
jgi:midasin